MANDLITIEEAAAYLGLNIKTVYNGNGGTDHFLRVKLGRNVRLLRSEVVSHRDEIVASARNARMRMTTGGAS